ncbi:MAG: hypothetical protein KatS3mg082_1880 [Nitrospiraceae bacterium]|nr:MAG: hypothetical protein KatS3mg082_1880 [Nitrospiraceae bacterium]
MADSPSLQPRSLGRIAVPTPGTPVRVTSDISIRAHRIRFAVVIGETGRVFLGVAGMNKATGAGVVKEFWPTGAGGGVADELVLESASGELRPADYYVDANTAGEGLIVAYWVWAPSYAS